LQFEQKDEPVELNNPAEHDTQEELPSNAYLPAVHVVQAVDPAEIL
jgi:hypothetical protein